LVAAGEAAAVRAMPDVIAALRGEKKNSAA